uniref:Unannotated protein n=1 Tax=freshwater metagenome TaxID=449393 RepID=A0A6J6A2X4_9ZZZZ
MLAERLIFKSRSCGEISAGHLDFNSLVAQDPEATAVGLLRRIVAGDDHASDPCSDDRVGAGGLAPFVTARLKRNVDRCAVQVGGSAVSNRVHLGVGLAVSLVPAFTEDHAIARDNSANLRVGTDIPEPRSPELYRPRQQLFITG